MTLKTTFDSEIDFTIEGDWVADIVAMHEKFGEKKVVSTFEKPKLESYLKFRLDLLMEEVVEAYEAAGYTVNFEVIKNGAPPAERAEDVVDACIDVCVIAIGTLNVFNVDAYEAWARVHEKNMQKDVGFKLGRPNPLGLPDLMKPAGWTSPTHADNVGLLSKVFE